MEVSKSPKQFIKQIIKYLIGVLFIAFGAFLFLCFIAVIAQNSILGIMFLIVFLLLCWLGIRLLKKNQAGINIEGYSVHPYPLQNANEIYSDNSEGKCEKAFFSSDDVDDTSFRNNQSAFNDYRKTIFLHLFEKHPYKEDDSFPGYFQYEYNIINMPMYFREIKDEGFLCEADYADILNMAKIPELKNILTSLGLKKTGNKADLIERILSNIDNSTLPTLNSGYYSLSEKGKLFIKLHFEYIELKHHSEWNISFDKYLNAKNAAKSTSDFYDIILSLLYEQLNEAKKLNRNEPSRYTYYKLHELYNSIAHIFQEKKSYHDALKSWLHCVLLSVSGCQNQWLISYYWGTNVSKQNAMNNYAPAKIDCYVAQSVCDLQDYYSEEIAQKVYSDFIDIFNLCPFDMFLDIINRIFVSSALDISDCDEFIKTELAKKLNSKRNVSL